MKDASKTKEICESLRQKLRQGAEALPSERALMRRFSTTRETVRRAIDQLKYEGLVVRRQGKGTFARKGRKNGPLRIGLLVMSYAEIFTPICAEIGKICRERDVELLFADVSALDFEARSEQAMRYVRDFIANGVDGVVMQPVCFVRNAASVNLEIRNALEESGTATVLLDSGWPDGEGAADIAGVDNFSCGAMLARHFISKGVKKAVFMTLPHCPQSNLMRFHGIRSLMPCEMVTAAPDDVRAIKRMMSRCRPDAIACGYDVYAATLLKTLERIGVSVPGDVLLTGFDDVRYATLVSPQLTTIAQPCAEIARTAVDLLMGRLECPLRPPRSVFLRAGLIPRESSVRSGKKGRKKS